MDLLVSILKVTLKQMYRLLTQSVNKTSLENNILWSRVSNALVKP